MITKRIIPCLDVKNGRVVKGVNFDFNVNMFSTIYHSSKFNYLKLSSKYKILPISESLVDDKQIMSTFL